MLKQNLYNKRQKRYCKIAISFFKIILIILYRHIKNYAIKKAHQIKANKLHSTPQNFPNIIILLKLVEIKKIKELLQQKIIPTIVA